MLENVSAVSPVFNTGNSHKSTLSNAFAPSIVTSPVFASITTVGAIVTIPAIVIGALYLIIGVFASLAVEFIDKKLTNGEGFSSVLGAMYRNVGEWLKTTFKTLNESNYTYSDYNYDFCKAC